MDMETVRLIQGVAFIVFIIVLTFVLYGYYFHLRKSEKTGERDYEKYGNLALNDNIDDELIEPYPSKKEDAKEELEK